MKKTYQKPEMKVILVSTKHMLCLSTLEKSNSTVSDINALQSRRGGFSFWDDEEE